MTHCAALVVAAGRGARFGGEVPKQYRLLGGRMVLSHALQSLAADPSVGTVRCVIHPEDRALYEAAAAGLSLPAPVEGGATRGDSVRRGLESLASEAPETVLIHDGARPFVPRNLVAGVVAALEHAAGAIAAVPVTDTLKRGTAGVVDATVPRDGLWRAQTPQAFRFAAILDAHRRSDGSGFTDDAQLLERLGLPVALVTGSEDNMKITTAEDLHRAERLLAAMSETRVGTGFDVHRLGPGTGVRLCGIDIPHDRSLLGHSDADVALHAIVDALLGAIGAGDIGTHFPPSDQRWRGADSRIFLQRAAALVAAAGGRIVNVDLTLICEAPRIGPHRDAMRESLAAMLDVVPARIGVKATTTEGLGFPGRGEGIAAQAVATVSVR